eukprot:217348-Pelagomonas_calceolata.AAC.7
MWTKYNYCSPPVCKLEASGGVLTAYAILSLSKGSSPFLPKAHSLAAAVGQVRAAMCDSWAS